MLSVKHTLSMYRVILMPKMQWCCTYTEILVWCKWKTNWCSGVTFSFPFFSPLPYSRLQHRVMPCKLCIIEHSNKRASAYQHLKSVCPKNILSAFTLIFSIISMSLFNAVIGRSVFSIFLENLNVHNPLDFSYAQSTTKSLNNDKILLHIAMAKGQFMSIHLKEHNCLNIIHNV